VQDEGKFVEVCLFVCLYLPWSNVSAVALSCGTIRAEATALCNGNNDCTHANSPGNLLAQRSSDSVSGTRSFTHRHLSLSLSISRFFSLTVVKGVKKMR